MRPAILTLLLIGALLAQPATRFEINGKVLDADNGRPIANVRVTIQVRKTDATAVQSKGGFSGSIGGNTLPQDPGTEQVILLTDQAGSFRLTNASAGQYSISSEKPGYIRSDAGNRPGATGFPVKESSPAPVTIYLRRQATMQGTILDDRGIGLSGLVSVYRQSVQNGRVVAQLSGTVQLDSSGSFRIAGLSPNRYYVAYSPNRSGKRRTFGFALYPGVADTKAARLVELQAGSQQEIHMRLKDEPAYRVSGTISQTDESLSFVLMPLASTGVPANPQYAAKPPGGFRFDEVPAGQYQVMARLGQVAIASTTITVTGQDVEGIILSPSSSRLEIRATFDPPAATGQSAFVQVQLESETAMIYTQADPQGAQVADGLLPGVYRLRPQLQNPRYVRSARQGSRDVLREGVLVTSGSSAEPVQIVVATGSARVEGTVEIVRDKPITKYVVFLRRTGQDLLMQEQRPVFTSDLEGVRSTQAPQDGKRFLVEAMPPGEYLVFAWDAANGNPAGIPYNTEEFHRKFGPYLERFTIRDSELVNLTVRRLLPAAALEAY